jgi:hypothetical protein
MPAVGQKLDITPADEYSYAQKGTSSTMGRVINTDSIGKARNQNMRLAAELLRHLSQKTEVDAESKDMLAALILAFKAIEDGIDEAMLAWEKRNYWNKVEEFRMQWAWVGAYSARLENLLRTDGWEQLPQQLMNLFKYFTDITITRFTHGPEAWAGAYEKLMQTTAPTRRPGTISNAQKS